jgi:hypothetical protein
MIQTIKSLSKTNETLQEKIDTFLKEQSHFFEQIKFEMPGAKEILNGPEPFKSVSTHMEEFIKKEFEKLKQ